jgi:hypothetical protein
MPSFLIFNAKTKHIESYVHNSFAMFSLKTLYSGVIRTRVLGVMVIIFGEKIVVF